ncbi:hypothetical protein L226DRAFT_547559 [Lentinus tigrinus ALCF2SS1-7]|uniref:HMG box domain-containing protein n=1 Tax=Lentinus tigrinus ALCF2SS1-6 TaxID=1328759 RepID=A0A5C2S941_9APHY|nr:hypothetical protein L227DRAFT_653447 [Lentinus tigrinus ALCF2SS1-6]RPD70908.1 hypothetical protein L226DRAFT_547559 [Lentinus tigrinus ALCF2SS1-7]
MSPARSSLIRRRRSSVAMGLTQVKPGNYGINTSSSPRALTFAPNVTPGTYVEADDDLDGEDQTTLPATALFPPTEPTAAPTRRRLPPGKRLSQGYIPRPPNAFMLFRANFVRQKHVPGSIETNHGSLSKIIGNCWRALPLEEKRHWEHEAKKAKAAHREKWPNYRFRPVHNKNKKKGGDAAVPVPIGRKDKLQPPPADEERCEVVAQLLLEGKKGEELAEAIRQIDMARAMSRPESAESHHVNNQFAQSSVPLYLQRRPSSVPPPTTLYNPAHNIAIPSLPFFAAPTPQAAFGSNAMFNGAEYPMGVNSAHGSRAASPVGNIARAQRNFLGMRRASSCQPIPSERMWDGYDPHPHHLPYGQPAPVPAAWQMQLQPDWEPLPEVTDASIFQPGWTNSFKDAPPEPSQFDPHMQAYLPPDAPPPHATLHVNIGPLDNYDFASTPSTATDSYSAVTPGAGGMFEPIDPHATWPVPESGPSSAFSGSPAHSDSSLPTLVNGQVPHQVDHQGPLMCAPQPQHPQLQFNDSWAAEHELDKMHAAQQPVSMHDDQHISTLLDDTYAMYGDVGMDGMDMGMEMAPVGVDYGYGAVSQEF